MDRELVISIKTILFTAALLVALYVFYLLRPVVFLLIIATILTLALEPVVQFFSKKTVLNKPMPRTAAVLLTYFLSVLSFVMVLTLVSPTLVSQVSNLINVFNKDPRFVPLIREIGESIGTEGLQVSQILNNIVTATVSVFSNLFAVFTVIVLSLYMSIDFINIKKRFIQMIPSQYREEVREVLSEIEVSIGHWVKGQLILMVVVGFATTLGLYIIGIEYALALGVFSGLLEIVPLLGPIIAAFVATIIGFSISPATGFLALGLFILIQQLENNLLVPKVMQRVSGFSPLVVLLAILVGGELFGVIGALVSIPVTMVLVIIAKHILRHSFNKH